MAVRRPSRLAILVAALAVAVTVAAGLVFQLDGHILDLDRHEAEAVRRPGPVARLINGPDGVPVVDYGPEIGVQENPVTVAGWALDNPQHLRRGADWLLDRQRPDGSWRYAFAYEPSLRRLELDPGWASGMAQGRAMFALVMAYEETGDERYARAAAKAFDFLMVPVSQGGVRTSLDGGMWFEEYPTSPPSYVLNGFLFTLEGLWNARDVVDGAAEAYAAGRETLEANLERWNFEGKVVYDLVHETHPTDDTVMYDSTYDPIHERLLRGQLDIRDSDVIRKWLAVWYG